jgi:integrase
VKLKKNPTNNIIYVHFKGERGRVRMSTGTRNMEQAKVIVAEMGVERLENMAKAKAMTTDAVQRAFAGKRITCGKALKEWEAWMHRVTRSSRTVESHVASVTAFLRDSKIMTSPVSIITEAEIDTYINDIESKRSAATRERLLTTIRRYIEYCSAQHYIMGNPAKLVPVKMQHMSHEQKEPKKRKAFSPGQIAKIMSALDGEWWSAVAVALDTGLRLGDVCNLEWATFDTEEDRIVVWTDKRDKRVSLPMTPRLKRIKNASPRASKRYVHPGLSKTYQTKGSAHLSVYFGRQLKKIGIEGGTFHSLRSTFSQNWQHLGKSVDEIRIALGHDDEKTTKDHYL